MFALSFLRNGSFAGVLSHKKARCAERKRTWLVSFAVLLICTAAYNLDELDVPLF
ncbi:hypothetical protein CLOSTMETH_03799 [[Clostridium] methylpentosum DSM 5476]|uniref:Uncharacterized protein n=1 Tax=[Clostridium] methylpentosum DSM 5476 TaxID=537013 RepID=C0EIV5_9FIRM|nr:hypothetical protein CLOSTMETH_03799 [[Clostridium] methylpentosum DSM 5476]